MLIIVNVYIVDTNIYSLHLVVNIIVLKRFTKINKVIKTVRIKKFNYRLNSNRRLLKHRSTN